MNLNPRLSIFLPLFIVASSLCAAILFPTHGTECEGYSLCDLPDLDDTVTDVSWITAYGEPVTWRYVAQGDTAFAELRGDSWRGYKVSGDTLFFIHAETFSEKTDLRVALVEGQGTQPYLARSRRQMAFCYLDSGTFSTTAGITPVLILAEGDTVRDCPYRETVARYGRCLVDAETDSIGAVMGNIEDTERVWWPPQSVTPLAVAACHTVEVPGRDVLLTCMTSVFPRDAQSGTITENVAPRSMGSSETLSPAVTLEGTILRSGDTTSEILVCDMSGRVWLSSRSAGATLDLSGLPAGTYVVSFIRGDQPRESAVIMLE